MQAALVDALPDPAIASALTRVMSSIEELASNCRHQGIDPMAMLMTMLSGGSVATGVSTPRAPSPSGLQITSDIPSDAEVDEHSRNLVDALSRYDMVLVAPALAPGFVHYRGDAPMDRDTTLMTLVERKSHASLIASRTWADRQVVRKDDVLVFVGKAHEVLSGNETHGGYFNDGSYLVQWVRVGESWQAQLLTWQRETTDREWWNDTFRNDRGFSHEPNRLLVESVGSETPGTALDVAMGQGRNALYLASSAWNVTGVDASDEGLRIAREKAVERGLAIETIHADIDEWDFGVERFDLVTLIYAGDHAKWIDKIKASLKSGGLFVVEGWAKTSPSSDVGFADGQLATLCDGYEILRDEIVEDVPDWAHDKGRLVRFVARKR